MSWSNVSYQAALPDLRHSRQQHEQRRRHVSVGDWFGGLSRRFSQKLGRQLSQQEAIADPTFSTQFVASVERSPGPPPIVVLSSCYDETDWGRPRKKKRAQKAAAAAAAAATTAATAAGGSGGRRQWLSHRERHKINLMYHLLRDHRDAIQLQVAAACCGAEGGGEEETACDSSSSLLWWWQFDEEEDEDTAEAAAAGDDSGSECCGGDAFGYCPLKSYDSDSCLSTCSNSSKRFKHKRRTDRWNQEFDFEFKVQHGFVDPDYFGVCQIK